jgi:hypothetical protein
VHSYCLGTLLRPYYQAIKHTAAAGLHGRMMRLYVEQLAAAVLYQDCPTAGALSCFDCRKLAQAHTSTVTCGTALHVQLSTHLIPAPLPMLLPQGWSPYC